MKQVVYSHLSHVLARALVVILPPKDVLPVIRRLTAWMPRLETGVARHWASALEPNGSCLTRAISVAARMEGAAIKVGGTFENGMLHAHAWVEVRGTPLRSWDPAGVPLATMNSAGPACGKLR